MLRVAHFVIVLYVFSNAVAVAQPSSPSPQPAPGAVVQPIPSPEAQPVASPIPGVLVPGGTIVTVSLVEPLSSRTAKEGDQIAVKVAKEVDVGGFVVIPAGAPGHATVETAEHAGSNGHGGQLALVVDWVYSKDGGKIKLSPSNHASENGQQKGAASTATLLSWALLGPVGFFAHNFVRGRDVTINTKKVFTVFVDHDVHVLTTTKAEVERFDR